MPGCRMNTNTRENKVFGMLVDEVVGDHGFVTWTYCNWGQRRMALNWWRHLERVAPDLRPLIFCLDAKTEEDLQRKGARTGSIRLAYEVSEAALPFRRSAAWSKLTLVKILLVHHLAAAGVRQFYSDTDIVAWRDPAALLLEHLNRHEIVFQNEHDDAICSGIILARPCQSVLRLFDLQAEGLPAYQSNRPGYGDQTFIKRRVAAMGDGLDWALLPKPQFPTGKLWYPSRAHYRETALLVHYNWKDEIGPKIAEMRQDGMWLAGEPQGKGEGTSSGQVR